MFVVGWAILGRANVRGVPFSLLATIATNDHYNCSKGTPRGSYLRISAGAQDPRGFEGFKGFEGFRGFEGLNANEMQIVSQ